MTTPCDIVAERVALGEPLGDLAEHAATCARCRRLAALPAELGVVHQAVDPGIGFTARMTVGAQHVLAGRRRRRVAVGITAATAVAAGGVFVITRPPASEPVAVAPAGDHIAPTVGEGPEIDYDVKTLVKLARVDRASHAGARWSRITKPLAPYRALVKGITP